MRRPERISIILNNISWFNFLQQMTKLNKMDADLKRLVDKITLNLYEIHDYWKQYPDLRLTQVLVNLNLMPNTPGTWYYTEETQWMIENEILEPREILFWGRNFTKTMKKLNKTQWILIKDMDTEHIKAVVEGHNHPLKLPWCKEPYLTYFKNELKLRNEKVSNTHTSRRKKA